jgi:hypothetical protein
LGFLGGGLGLQLAFGGQVFVQELLDLAFGQSAHETIDGLAVFSATHKWGCF